jgi:hypothetical protein
VVLLLVEVAHTNLTEVTGICLETKAGQSFNMLDC